MKGVVAASSLLLLEVSAFTTRPPPAAFSSDRLLLSHQLQHHTINDGDPDDYGSSDQNNNLFGGDFWKGFQPKKQQQAQSQPQRRQAKPSGPFGAFLSGLSKEEPADTPANPLDQVGEFFQTTFQQQQQQLKSCEETKAKADSFVSPLDQLGDFFKNNFQTDTTTTAPVHDHVLAEPPKAHDHDEEDEEVLVIRGGKVQAAQKGMPLKRDTKNVLDKIDISAVLGPSVLDTSFLETKQRQQKQQQEGALHHQQQQEESEKKNAFGGFVRFWGMSSSHRDSATGTKAEEEDATSGRVGEDIFHHKGSKRRFTNGRSSHRRMAYSMSSGSAEADDDDKTSHWNDVTTTINIPEEPTGKGIVKGAPKTLNGSAEDGFPKKQQQKSNRYNIDDMEETPFYTAYGRIPRPVMDAPTKRRRGSEESSPYGDVRNGWLWPKSKNKDVQDKPEEEKTKGDVKAPEVPKTPDIDDSSKISSSSSTTTTTTTTTVTTTTTTTETTANGNAKNQELVDKDYQKPWSLPAPFTAGATIDVEATPVSAPQEEEGAPVTVAETSNGVAGTKSLQESPPTFNPLSFFATKDAGEDSPASSPSSVNNNARAAATQTQPQRINLNELNDVQHLREKRNQQLLNNGRSPQTRPATPVSQFRSFGPPPSYPRNLQPKAPPNKAPAATISSTPPSTTSKFTTPVSNKNNNNNDSFLDEIKRGKAMLKADYNLLHPKAAPPKGFNPQHYQRANMNMQRRERESQLRRTNAPSAPPATAFMDAFKRITIPASNGNSKRGEAPMSSRPSTMPLNDVVAKPSTSLNDVVKPKTIDHSASVLRALSLRSTSPNGSSRSNGQAVPTVVQTSNNNNNNSPPSFRPTTQLISSQKMREQQREHLEAIAREKAAAEEKARLELAQQQQSPSEDVSPERRQRRSAPLKKLMKWMRKPSSNGEIE